MRVGTSDLRYCLTAEMTPVRIKGRRVHVGSGFVKDAEWGWERSVLTTASR